MKRLLQLLIIALLTISFSSVNAGNYKIDDNALDQMFAGANTISFAEMGAADLPGVADLTSSATSYNKDPLIAILLDFFMGPLGIHRFYLGTEPLTGIAYILTCGGIFGLVPLVDLIVLAVNYDDISPYVDNPRFFMW
ncbi:MAG: TM2 domain-containing protein [Prolixibacteraceae bacterium]|nr:TM2 domain-containing protein [Prolixibacteraceae bacterium]MBN2774785.1 TM2 domain-containing protein [Prolixibacteraceae bacterium]